jgi:hypothetical protein
MPCAICLAVKLAVANLRVRLNTMAVRDHLGHYLISEPARFPHASSALATRTTDDVRRRSATARILIFMKSTRFIDRKLSA